MCGIAGIWRAPGLGMNQTMVEDIAACMSDRLIHRGPDDGGVWSDGQQIALAHRRLSIQDLSQHGRQPMASGCERYVLVFNGEIYNFQGLKAELEQQGAVFQTRSDTEVLVTAIARWGLENALLRFNGMFAFALWDKQEKTLTLAQDRAGKKPLYFGFVGNSLVFASELKAIAWMPECSREIDSKALSLYLDHNYVPAPYCIYRGLYKLPQGSHVTLSLQQLDPRTDLLALIRHYWSPCDIAKAQYDKGYPREYSDAVGELDDLLKASTELRMVADVPVGLLLSGGIDSSLVAGVAQSLSHQPINTFSIGFSGSKTSEAVHAKNIARHLGTHHEELYLSGQDALDVVPRIPEIYDEPFGDSSQIPTFLVSELAKRDVKVALTGDGGDELFFGYKRYFSGLKLWQGLQKCPGPVKGALGGTLGLLAGFQHSESSLGQHRKVLAAKHPLDLYWARFSKFRAAHRLLNNGQPHALPNLAAVKALEIDDPALNMMLFDYTSYLTGDILVKVDRASMAVGLEARSPLLDYHISEFAWSLPTAFKYDETGGKRILREVLSRYVPRSLTERPKQGFGSPIRQWLSGPLREWADDLLSADKLNQHQLFNTALVQKLWQDCRASPKKSHSKMWNLLMFQAWYEHQNSQYSELANGRRDGTRHAG